MHLIEKVLLWHIHGCNNLFSTCAERFNNSDNFSGVCYIEPYDIYKNPVIGHHYWINDSVITRDTKGFVN